MNSTKQKTDPRGGSSRLTPFRGALFDMDGLLIDTERRILQAAVEAADALSLGDLRPTLLAMIGLRGDHSRPLLEAALAGRVSLDAFRAEWAARMSELERDVVAVRPGVTELLQRLAEQDVPCAVATSTDRGPAIELLERTALAPFFRSVTGGDDVVRPKPDPEIYRMAAATLDIEPGQACAFEDSNPGTRAAVASGATVVQVPDLVEPSAEVRALGHVIAPDVLAGARTIGLIA